MREDGPGVQLAGIFQSGLVGPGGAERGEDGDGLGKSSDWLTTGPKYGVDSRKRAKFSSSASTRSFAPMKGKSQVCESLRCRARSTVLGDSWFFALPTGSTRNHALQGSFLHQGGERFVGQGAITYFTGKHVGHLEARDRFPERHDSYPALWPVLGLDAERSRPSGPLRRGFRPRSQAESKRYGTRIFRSDYAGFDLGLIRTGEKRCEN